MCRCTNHTGLQILLDIMDRSQKLDHTTLGSQTCIFVVCSVIVCERFHSFHDSTSKTDIKKQCKSKSPSTCTVIILISYNLVRDYTEIWVRQYQPDEYQYIVSTSRTMTVLRAKDLTAIVVVPFRKFYTLYYFFACMSIQQRTISRKCGKQGRVMSPALYMEYLPR